MSTASAPSAWWLRLHAGLMPDYNRRAMLFWWAVVGLGALALGYHLWALRDLAAVGWLQIGLAAAFATLAGFSPVRLPGTRQSFVAGEIFIFLLLLLQGPEAAALASAAEAAVGAWRTSRRWTSRLISPAVASLSMGLVGLLLTQGLAPLAGLTPGAVVQGSFGMPALLAAMIALAALNFGITHQLIAAVPRLKRGAPALQVTDLRGMVGWVGLAYLGSAVVATLLAGAYRQSGAAVLMAVLPVLVLLMVSLHFYFLQQEAAETMRGVAARAATEAQRHLDELQASEQRFHSAFTHAAIGMALLDMSGQLLQANPALRSLLGLPTDAPLPPRFQDLIEDEHRASFDEGLRQSDEAGTGFTAFQLELRCRRLDGPALWVLVHCGFFHDPQANAPRLILQVQDISARRQAEAGLHRLAFHDSLTGLPNRRQLLDLLTTSVLRHQQDAKASFALMYLDFDRFKLVNDSLGHKAGDELLVQLARRIQENLRPSDVVARLGGDEFAVLVPHLHGDQDALQLAERLVAALRRPFKVAGHALFASASIGITFSRFGYANAEEVLRDADTAMYQAKAAGKARYALFNGDRPDDTHPQQRLEDELRTGLARGELTVAYQPLVALATGQLRGFEALVRWQHPRLGLLQPGTFIAVAEGSGLITPLSDFVLAQACHQLAQWQGLGPAWAELTMCVNLSGQELAHRGFVARIQQVLQTTGVAPRHLVLELTEEAVMTHLEMASANLSALRALGVQLSVDDFGTGYSSLSRLARLPIDSFKIDRSFVHELTSTGATGDLGDDSAVVRALVQMGGALGKTVVAEGIETALQADQLRRMGANLLGQGFHLAQPLSAADATAWLQRREDAPSEAALH